jgi:LCP family protein required for cell wall assembly
MVPEQFGPVATGGRRRRHGHLNWRRVGWLLVSFVLVISMTAGGTAVALLWYGQASLDRVTVPGLDHPGDSDGDGAVDITEISDVRNVLVVGSDSRDDLDRQAREELGLGHSFEGTRTDTIMIVQLDPGRDSAAMLSFPRDLLVPLCDGSEGRINSAYQIGVQTGVGGPSCLVRTVKEYTGIPINHYVQVDFQGFVEFVDRLGGVRMHLDQPIVDDSAHIDLPAGCQTLDGREALGFVRVRKIDSDFGRIARQQRFIREVIEQLSSARIAVDVPRLFGLVGAAATAVETDHSLSLGVMRQIAFSFRELSSDRIDARTVPAYNRTIGGAAYVVADSEPAAELFDAFARGVAAPRELGTEGPADVRIADVAPVTILNSTDHVGLAQQISDSLVNAGFDIATVGNFNGKRAARTFVEYPEGHREEAELVSKALGGARIVSLDAGHDFRVVLGADIDAAEVAALGQQQASEGPTQSAAPEASETPSYAGAADPEEHDC